MSGTGIKDNVWTVDLNEGAGGTWVVLDGEGTKRVSLDSYELAVGIVARVNAEGIKGDK